MSRADYATPFVRSKDARLSCAGGNRLPAQRRARDEKDEEVTYVRA